MEDKRIRICCCFIVFVTFASLQLINSLHVTKYGGYAIYRNQSGGLEFLLFKPVGQENWTLPDALVKEETMALNVSQDVLKKEFGLNPEDIKEVEDYAKTIAERVDKYMNMTTYRIAELLDAEREIALSSAYSDYRWWPTLDIDEYVDSKIRNIFKEIDLFLSPSVYN